MGKKYSKLLLITILLFAVSSCKTNILDPDAETPDVSLRLSEKSASTEIIISWNKCKDAEGYGITRTFTRDGVTEECIYRYISAETTSYTDSDCEPGTEYTYKVTAGYFKAGGLFYGRVFGDLLEATSEAKSITTASDPLVVLEHPKNINITPAAKHSNALKLTWTPCENATSYEIYQSRVHNDTFGEYAENYVKIQTVDAAECTALHIFNENTYRFKIKALGADGKSSVLSGWKSGTVPAATNISMDKAVNIENGVTERFYTPQDSLWFKITPAEGKLTVDSVYTLSVMLFSADGTKILKDDIDFTEKDFWFYGSFKDCITPGESYLMRIKSKECIQIIVE